MMADIGGRSTARPIEKRDGDSSLDRPLLTVAMIVKDEASYVGRVLSDVQDMYDELVVVDTGSRDSTVAEARRFGAKIFHIPWRDDFSAARNYSFDVSHGEWIMWLDADDRVPRSTVDYLNNLKHQLHKRTDIDVVAVPYRIYRKSTQDIQLSSVYRERIMRKDSGLPWEGRIFETIIPPDGRILKVQDAWIEHSPDADRTARNSSFHRRILAKAIIEEPESSRYLFHAGNFYLQDLEYSKAAEAFMRVLVGERESSHSYNVRIMLSLCFSRMNQRSKQMETLFEAMRDDTRRPEAYLLAADVYIEMEQPYRAIPMLSAASSFSSPFGGLTDEPSIEWRVLYGFARVSRMLSRGSEMRSFASRCLALSPGDSSIERDLVEMMQGI